MTIVAMRRHLPSSIQVLPLLRRSIFSSFHHSTRLHSCRTIRAVRLSNTANLSRFQAVFRRLNHSLQSDDQSINADYADSLQTDVSKQQKQNLTSEKRKVDPFAKRPSQKCDPYGLAGQSLSLKECLDWLATLECGWKLIHDATEKQPETEEQAPIFLRKQFYHATFHDASQFLSHISFLSTNLNHFPFLSMERVLVDDLNTVSNNTTNGRKSDATSASSAQTSAQKRRRVKGWVFVSTVRCSTYRPPTTRADLERQDDSSQSKDKGL
eukprot:CAMPEP_0201700486 /NCGR_PEP_ID=MMETSP0578-20130828/28678_1 /ASSEMBLY_ACC=CAM_ASM_000663 /TAXON_ID=267565 /ORGANISM="Skeletonema grethea, Strain CCMP 1804" /LENGTH=267 /DNA_ID=CAMNT_0048187551 /DNA_START=38 /DNA_END=838 /DNA_ORIENTATION=-